MQGPIFITMPIAPDQINFLAWVEGLPVASGIDPADTLIILQSGTVKRVAAPSANGSAQTIRSPIPQEQDEVQQIRISETPKIDFNFGPYAELLGQDRPIRSFSSKSYGNPREGQHLWLVLKGKQLVLIKEWGHKFEDSSISLPELFGIERTDCEFIWNGQTARWRIVRFLQKYEKGTVLIEWFKAQRASYHSTGDKARWYNPNTLTRKTKSGQALCYLDKDTESETLRFKFRPNFPDGVSPVAIKLRIGVVAERNNAVQSGGPVLVIGTQRIEAAPTDLVVWATTEQFVEYAYIIFDSLADGFAFSVEFDVAHFNSRAGACVAAITSFQAQLVCEYEIQEKR